MSQKVRIVLGVALFLIIVFALVTQFSAVPTVKATNISVVGFKEPPAEEWMKAHDLEPKLPWEKLIVEPEQSLEEKTCGGDNPYRRFFEGERQKQLPKDEYRDRMAGKTPEQPPQLPKDEYREQQRKQLPKQPCKNHFDIYRTRKR